MSVSWWIFHSIKRDAGWDRLIGVDCVLTFYTSRVDTFILSGVFHATIIGLAFLSKKKVLKNHARYPAITEIFALRCFSEALFLFGKNSVKLLRSLMFFIKGCFNIFVSNFCAFPGLCWSVMFTLARAFASVYEHFKSKLIFFRKLFLFPLRLILNHL